MEENHRECAICEIRDAIIKKTLRAVKKHERVRFKSIDELEFLNSLNGEQTRLLNRIKKQLKAYYVNDLANQTIEELFNIFCKNFTNEKLIYFD